VQRREEQARSAAILQEQLAERQRQRLREEELRDQVGGGKEGQGACCGCREVQPVCSWGSSSSSSNSSVLALAGRCLFQTVDAAAPCEVMYTRQQELLSVACLTHNGTCMGKDFPSYKQHMVFIWLLGMWNSVQ
jgi:hypothetical protein